MDVLFKKNYKKIHFIGILGSSMHSLAVFAKNFGYKVSGSDSDKNFQINPFYAKLAEFGIDFFCGHDAENITDAEVVVFSSSIKTDNPEFSAAIIKGIYVLERGKFLGLVSAQFKNVIAISGAHGKTTASGLIADIFYKLKNASFHIGGKLQETDSSFIMAGKEFFVTEACEYMSNFLWLEPTVGVILNIEFDHPDYFKNLYSVEKVFSEFAKKSIILITNSDCESCNKIKHKNVYRYAARCNFEYADICAKNIIATDAGLCFDIAYEDVIYNINTRICGDFNVSNILAAFAASIHFGLDLKKTVEIINKHRGILRRSEKLFLKKNKKAILDYAHHPTQVFSMLNFYKHNGPLLCVFEPHTYSRTRALMDDFADALQIADEIILLPIYAAREKKVPGLLEELAKKTQKKCQILSPSKALKYAKSFEGEILFLGAGNIDKLFLKR